MKPVWFTLGIAFMTAIIFGLISLLFYFGEWSRFLLVSIFGFSVGTIAAPEIDASLYKHGWAIQIMGGIFGGASFSLLVTTDIQLIFAVSILGALIGWLGPFWIKHTQVPQILITGRSSRRPYAPQLVVHALRALLHNQLFHSGPRLNSSVMQNPKIKK